MRVTRPDGDPTCSPTQSLLGNPTLGSRINPWPLTQISLGDCATVIIQSIPTKPRQGPSRQFSCYAPYGTHTTNARFVRISLTLQPITTGTGTDSSIISQLQRRKGLRPIYDRKTPFRVTTAPKETGSLRGEGAYLGYRNG